MNEKVKKVAIILVPLAAIVVFLALYATHVIAFKPGDISDDAWRCGRSAYQLANDAIDGKTDYSTASDRMKAIADSIDTSSGTSQERAANTHVQYCIVAVATDLSICDTNAKSGYTTLRLDLDGDMKSLAKVIGY